MKKTLINIGFAFLCLLLLFDITILGQILYILNCSSSIGSKIIVNHENKTFGGSLYTLKNDNTFEVERIYV